MLKITRILSTVALLILLSSPAASANPLHQKIGHGIKKAAEYVYEYKLPIAIGAGAATGIYALADRDRTLHFNDTCGGFQHCTTVPTPHK